MTESLKFEKAIERLEGIVSKLESGDMSLDEALRSYEEGVSLVRGCRKQLLQVEQKIEVLTRQMNGELSLESFEAGDEAVKKKKSKKSSHDR